MNRWIATKYLDDFRQKLADEKDPNTRRVLAELIVEEKQKVREPDGEQN